MARKPALHTEPARHGDGWENRREGSPRASAKFSTQKAAAQAGQRTARRERLEHVIHRSDGSIGERNSYGNDPHPPKG